MAQPERLDTLAEQINEEHVRVKAAFGKTLQHAKRAGQLLVEAKERTPHGQWGPWLETNFEFTERTAQYYMRIYSRWSDIVEKTKSVSDLSITGALRAIGPPQEATITRERVEGPPQWPSEPDTGSTVGLTRKRVDGELNSKPVGSPKREGASEHDDDESHNYDYAQAMIAKVKEGDDRIVEVIRVVSAEYLVRRGDGNTLRVTREPLLEAGWQKCSCCNGYGITNNSA